MKARIWFEGRGQAMRARGYTWSQVKRLMNLYSLPDFAQRAIARGHMFGAASTVRKQEREVQP